MTKETFFLNCSTIVLTPKTLPVPTPKTLPVPVPAPAPNYTSHSILQENSDKHDRYYVKDLTRRKRMQKVFFVCFCLVPFIICTKKKKLSLFHGKI
jgi:hypothetical protein